MKIDNKKVIYVGFAFLLIQAFWIAYDAIIPIALVNKFGMNQTWSGIIMALDNILAIFLLPIFGSLSDKTKSRMGKRKPYVLIGTLCAIVAFFGLSLADYWQVSNLNTGDEQLQTMWDEYGESEITNNEYSTISENKKNSLDPMVKLHDYVAEILFGKSYAELDADEAAAARTWYVGIEKTDTYIKESAGQPYKVYRYDEDGNLCRVEIDGATLLNVEVTDEAETAKVGSVDAVNCYNVLVSGTLSVYARHITTENPLTLAVFMIMLLLTLIAMAVFRSPAVALMPDVVVRSERSKGNAIINLMGMVGGIVILALGMLFKTDSPGNQGMPYIWYILCVCAVMLVALLVFMFKVKEPEWAQEMLRAQAEMDERDRLAKQSADNAATATAAQSATVADVGLEETSPSVAPAQPAASPAAAEGGEASAAVQEDGTAPAENGNTEQLAPDISQKTAKKKPALSRGKLVSLILILLSVAFWYMGYNAVTSKYSLYSMNVLHKPFNLVLIVAQIMGVISFIPIGILSGKFGRKPMILFGVTLLALTFAAAYLVEPSTPDWVLYLLFSLAGIAWASINVNSFPMVVELASDDTVGKYTGFYYTASMAAQIATPFLSGLLMDLVGSMRPLFIYGTLFVAFSFFTMLFVRHGESKTKSKKSALEYLDAGD